MAAADDWRTYHNDRYGTTIEYPDIFKPGTPPDNNDGLEFKSEDGADFSVFASFNALDFDLAGFQDFIVKNLDAGAVADSTKPTATTGSSFPARKAADRIFYERHICPTVRR